LLDLIEKAVRDRSKVLSLRRSQLVSLPHEIGQLESLEVLLLSDNWLIALPPEMVRLTCLQQLDLSDNDLASLPPEIGQLTSLRELDLSGNQLSSLSSVIARLRNLQKLDLRNNKLSALPPEIARLPDLFQIDLAGNPLKTPPMSVVKQGLPAIRNYFRGREEKSTPQWLSKLLLVGEGGVGKTSLLHRLRGEAFDPQEDTTRGVQIHAVELPHPAKPGVTMKLNAWDFGGQEIYHAIHQFFLTDRSLFFVVWNARAGYEQGKLYYWLDAINSLAPESPVLLVATWADQREPDLPLADLRRKYPQIVGQCVVSNDTGAGIDALRERIQDLAAGLPLMGEPWPAAWLSAAEAIRGMECKHITPHELSEVLSRHGVQGESQWVLSRWLHDLGDILYFQDDDELNSLVILKPQWLTHYISRVLDDDEVAEQAGVFKRAAMDRLWADIEPGMRNLFLRLMERFDLSYRTLEDKDISLVVERLALDEPAFQDRWVAARADGEANEIAMKFRLNTLPAGIPTWFIARSHRFSTGVHWRFGALFEDRGDGCCHTALARAFPHDRYVELAVRGPNPQNFFALLRDGMDETLSRFPGLKVTRTVPCPGHGSQPCPHEFDLKHLEAAVKRNPPVMELQCPVSFENVAVAQLLFGIHWSTQDAVMRRISEAQSAVVTAVEQSRREVLEELQDFRALAQREFTDAFRREQAVIDSYCPNVFVLRAGGKRRGPHALGGQSLELQLYCQEPGCWHPTGENGRYSIPQPAEWLPRVAPYVRGLVTILKTAAPFVNPGLSMVIDKAFTDEFGANIKLMEEIVKKLPDGADDMGERLARDLASHGTPRQVGGADLRAVRQLLDEVDKPHAWGGLERVLTPEGHYLWLCAEHANRYKV
jgi:GTPase SAR1 family protein